MPIPRLIHQTIKHRNGLHPILRMNIEKLRALNPAWQHHLYDDSDVRKFIFENYSPNVLRYFEQINPVYGPARADFFRYLLLYKLGGVYLDVKSTATRPLDEVITSDDYLLSHWNNAPGQRYQGWGLFPGLGEKGEFQQWHIVTPPQHPFLKAVIMSVMWNIDNYLPALHGIGKLGVLRITGPIAYTTALLPIQGSYAHKVVDIEQLGFVYSVTGGPGRELSHEALFRHHYRNARAGEPVVLSEVSRATIDERELR